MKIEDQTISLDQAKKLHELGVEYKDYQYAFVDFTTHSGQESVLCRPASSVEEHSREWAWFMVGEHSEEIQAKIDEDTISADGGVYPAFTVAELGVMIDWNYASISAPYKDEGVWFLHTDKDDFDNTNEAVVRADLLIHLIEKKIITVESVNQRLNQ